jgi:hypothetical protein
MEELDMGLLDNFKPLERMGEGPYLRQDYPKVYGALGGLLGFAPDSTSLPDGQRMRLFGSIFHEGDSSLKASIFLV